MTPKQFQALVVKARKGDLMEGTKAECEILNRAELFAALWTFMEQVANHNGFHSTTDYEKACGLLDALRDAK